MVAADVVFVIGVMGVDDAVLEEVSAGMDG